MPQVNQNPFAAPPTAPDTVSVAKKSFRWQLIPLTVTLMFSVGIGLGLLLMGLQVASDVFGPDPSRLPWKSVVREFCGAFIAFGCSVTATVFWAKPRVGAASVFTILMLLLPGVVRYFA